MFFLFFILQKIAKISLYSVSNKLHIIHNFFEEENNTQ